MHHGMNNWDFWLASLPALAISQARIDAITEEIQTRLNVIDHNTRPTVVENKFREKYRENFK